MPNAVVLATPTSEAVATGIAYGSTVEVQDRATGRLSRYTLVHTHEANPAQGLLSEASPIGKALLGRRAGDQARVLTPRGLRELLILTVI